MAFEIERFDLESKGGTILWLHAETTKEISEVFVRIQEFYESQFKEIQGQYFKLADLKKLYIEQRGSWSYYSDWGGFNVPGKVVREFFEVFKKDLRRHEKRILNSIKDIKDNKFYLIGTETVNRWTFDHEVAHAFYRLIPSYRRRANNIVAHFKMRFPDEYTNMVKVLKGWGYCNKVITDEIHAYLGTSSQFELDDFDMCVYDEHVVELQDLFAATLKTRLGAYQLP